MYRFIPAILLGAMLFAATCGAEAGDTKPSISPEETRRNLIDLYCPLMLGFYAQKGDTEMVKLLLAGGMDANAVAKGNGNTALMLAANAGHMDTVVLLLENGADVNLPNNDGETPLIMASSRLEDGADDIISVNGSGEITVVKASPIEKIIERKKDVVRLLIEKGAKINSVAGDKRTALKAAKDAGYNGIAEALVAAGAKE